MARVNREESLFEIRRARVEDAGGIVAAVRSGIDPDLLGTMIYGCDGIDRFVEDQIGICECGADTAYTVAAAGDTIAGCVELRLMPGELFLNYISILPGYRSSGLGRRLLAEAILAANREEARAMSLDVLDHNRRARAWYERLGFEYRQSLVWWDVDLCGREGAPEALVCGYPQALAGQERFGFGQFRLVTPRGEYAVGLLGRDWFRLTQPEALADSSVASALSGLGRRRRVLAVVPDTARAGWHTGHGRIMAGSHRLHADINKLLRSLVCAMGI